MSDIIRFDFEKAQPIIERLINHKPLVLCITNSVVQNFTANILLACQASPAMLSEPEEIACLGAVAQAVLVNIGTVNQSSAKAMLSAAKTAHDAQVPWVLDPVAYSPLLPLRYRLVPELLQYQPTAIRGNAAEILTLAGKEAQSKGPDSLATSENAIEAAQIIARQYATVVAVTGVNDYITDGNDIIRVSGGHEMLTKITGTGCSLSALIAAFLSVKEVSRLQAVAASCQLVATAADHADKSKGVASFACEYLDQLSLRCQTK